MAPKASTSGKGESIFVRGWMRVDVCLSGKDFAVGVTERKQRKMAHGFWWIACEDGEEDSVVRLSRGYMASTAAVRAGRFRVGCANSTIQPGRYRSGQTNRQTDDLSILLLDLHLFITDV